MIKQFIGAKLPKEEARLFKDFCKARGESESSVLRRLIFTELARYSYLTSDRKKALGVARDAGGGDEVH